MLHFRMLIKAKLKYLIRRQEYDIQLIETERKRLSITDLGRPNEYQMFEGTTANDGFQNG